MLGIGFDTFDNGELNDNHVSLHWDGIMEGEVAATIYLNDNEWHSAEIEADLLGGRVAVLIDGTLQFDAPVPGLLPFEMRPDISARTGLGYDNHDVDEIVFDITLVPEPGEVGMLVALSLLGVGWGRRIRR